MDEGWVVDGWRWDGGMDDGWMDEGWMGGWIKLGFPKNKKMGK